MADLQYEITFLGRQIQEMADQFESDGKEWKNDADRERFDKLGVKLADAKRSHQPSGRIPGQIDTVGGRVPHPTHFVDGVHVGQATTQGSDGSYIDMDLTEVPGLGRRVHSRTFVYTGSNEFPPNELAITSFLRPSLLGFRLRATPANNQSESTIER